MEKFLKKYDGVDPVTRERLKESFKKVVNDDPVELLDPKLLVIDDKRVVNDPVELLDPKLLVIDDKRVVNDEPELTGVMIPKFTRSFVPGAQTYSAGGAAPPTYQQNDNHFDFMPLIIAGLIFWMLK